MAESSSVVDDVINEERVEPSAEELESFKNLVNDWFKYDDQIRKLQTAIKERKNYQRVLNGKIENYLIFNEIFFWFQIVYSVEKPSHLLIR